MVAYRSDDWYYYAEEQDLILADLSTAIGRRIDEIGNAGLWGSATSWPAVRGAEICSLELTQDGLLPDDDREITLGQLFPNGLPWESNPSARNGTSLVDRQVPQTCGPAL